MQKAIIVLVDSKESIYDAQYSIDELSNLALSNDIMTVYTITQKLNKPTVNFYVGKGKVEEIKLAINAYSPDLVIFDDELSPTQLRNLEKELEITIIDRSLLILDIFAKRAKTNESILEIKLAQNKYILPRLAGLNNSLSRQGGTTGGFSSKGPGEKQIELDRRHLLKEINHIEIELANIRKMKLSQIEKRKANEIPIVALVGYTNAGKSSTMNTILEAMQIPVDKQVYAKNELFATLNTYTRKVCYDKVDFLLVDTIGFVSKLPHHLINSFNQTLEEIKHADYIIHVVDVSSPYYQEQIHVTTQVLNNLGCSDIPTLLLLNKYDLLDFKDACFVGAKNLAFSNKTKLNVDTLLKDIVATIKPSTLPIEVLIPYSKGDVSHFIEENVKILSKVHLDNGILYNIEIRAKNYSKVANYEIKDSKDYVN